MSLQRLMSQLEAVLGSKARSGQQFDAWDAAYGPIGADGYPRRFWDRRTGMIDKTVAAYWRDKGYDLTWNMRRTGRRSGRRSPARCTSTSATWTTTISTSPST